MGAASGLEQEWMLRGRDIGLPLSFWLKRRREQWFLEKQIRSSEAYFEEGIE